MILTLPDKKSRAQDVQAFIGKVKNTPLVTGVDKGRLIFAMDGTASREHCWDMASQKHAAMFSEADKVSALSVQLCYYRGWETLQHFLGHAARMTLNKPYFRYYA
ncbi:MAG: hypothetical protein ACI9LX_000568 [Paraglaciecola sp.]|jgi:hypothetical protein